MTESNIKETYTKEVRRRFYDDPNSKYIDRSIDSGRSRLIPINSSTQPVVYVEKEKYQIPHQKAYDIPLERYSPYVEKERAHSQRAHDSPLETDRSDIRQIVAEEVAKLKNDKKRDQKKNELIELRKAVEELHKTVLADIERRNNKPPKKSPRDELQLADVDKNIGELRKQLHALLESQSAIHQELANQRDDLRKYDEARLDTDRLLRNDLTEALTEHKQITDASIQELARKVSDLVSDNLLLRKKLEDVSRNLQQLYASSASSDSEDERAKTKKNKKRVSSSSSDSIHEVLTPQAQMELRRPSQAVIVHQSTDRFAEETAKKALADATRISAQQKTTEETTTRL